MSAEIIPFPRPPAPRALQRLHQEQERQEYVARVRQVAADLIAAIHEQRAAETAGIPAVPRD